jgi:hypothetical protein
MNFKWDNTKNKTNIKKHGIDFSDAVQMFDYPLLTCIDRKNDYKEERWVGIGILKGIIAVIVYTEDDMNVSAQPTGMADLACRLCSGFYRPQFFEG